MADAQAASFVMHGAREAMANGMPHIEEQIKGIERAVVENPGLAFDLSKTLIESVCKTILTEREISFTPDDDLPKLFKVVTTNLPFLPISASGEGEARKSLKKTLNGLHTAVQGVCELRNAYGFASHGSEGHRLVMETVQALMVTRSADAIVGFLHRVHRQERAIATGADLTYDEHSTFNDYVDEANSPVYIFDLEYRPSEVLFQVDPQAYRDFLANYETEPERGETVAVPPQVTEGDI